MLPCQIIRLGISGRDCPQMAGSLRRLAALPEVRIDGEVVAHRILPPIIVGLVVGKSIAANETTALDDLPASIGLSWLMATPCLACAVEMEMSCPPRHPIHPRNSNLFSTGLWMAVASNLLRSGDIHGHLSIPILFLLPCT